MAGTVGDTVAMAVRGLPWRIRPTRQRKQVLDVDWRRAVFAGYGRANGDLTGLDGMGTSSDGTLPYYLRPHTGSHGRSTVGGLRVPGPTKPLPACNDERHVEDVPEDMPVFPYRKDLMAEGDNRVPGRPVANLR